MERLQSTNMKHGEHATAANMPSHATSPVLHSFNPELLTGHSPSSNGSVDGVKERSISSARHSLPGYETITSSSGDGGGNLVKFDIAEGHDDGEDEDRDRNTSIVSNDSKCSHSEVVDPPMQMFVCCDENTFIIGGG